MGRESGRSGAWLVLYAIVWVALLVAWVPFAVDPRDNTTGAWLIGAALAWTVGWGALLGYRRAWGPIGLSVPVGAGLLTAGAAVAVALDPRTGADAPDGESGPGAVLLGAGLLTLLGSALLLALGAGAGLAVRALRGRR
ncbi:hypothetical protein ACFW1A_21485 [Kitasatospora sp. NPDC058965]|uniref:hypothetical protein n=1 Tax=Kitasatospora sp. NPDC058965 TaxID=3346682 RepID=UPI003678D112